MKKISLREHSRRVRSALLVAIGRLPLEDSARVRELFERWQQLARQLGLLDGRQKKARR